MKKHIWIIIILAALLRLINIGQPLLEGSATRQIFSAMVAKYFYQEQMNMLYPRLFIKGVEPFYAALEIQLAPFLAAFFYKLLNGVYSEVLRIISVSFTVLSIYFLYNLIVEIFNNKKLALITTFIFSFSPISIYLGRSANFEMHIIFFNIATIFYFYKWVKNERLIYAALANLAFIFAVSLKVPNIYLLVPLGFLAFSKWRWRAFSKNWMMAISFLIIIAVQGWLQYLRTIGPDKNWLHFSLAYNLQSIRECFTSLEFYKKTYNDALNYVLTPLGLTFAAVGLLLKREDEGERILLFWLLGVLMFYAVMPEGLWAHGYYHMHYLPILAFFASKGFLHIIEKDRLKPNFPNPRTSIVIFGLLFLLLSARYSIPFYIIPENKRHILKTAGYVKMKVSPNELIISCVDSPATLLYYSERRGWTIDFSDKGANGITILEDLRSRGAAYFACAYKKELEVNKEFMRYLITHYKVILENQFCLIVDLRK